MNDRGLSLAVAGEHLIFLDLAKGRYFGLPDDDNRLLLDLLGRDENDPRARQVLADIIGIEADIAALRALLVLPRAPAAEWGAPKTQGMPCWRDRVAVIGYRIMTVLTLRARGLRVSLADLSRERDVVNAMPTELERLVVAHLWLERYATAANACLVRSLSLARHALSSGCDVSLFIGVKTDPFEAHSWVQSGDCVLNDTLERVAAFTPILVVP